MSVINIFHGQFYPLKTSYSKEGKLLSFLKWSIMSVVILKTQNLKKILIYPHVPHCDYSCALQVSRG